MLGGVTCHMVTSPTWGPLPSCKQALRCTTSCIFQNLCAPSIFSPCKGIQESLGLLSWILDSMPWFPNSRHSQWNLDYGLQTLVGFWIPWAVFQIPKRRIPESTFKNFPDSGIEIPLQGPLPISKSPWKAIQTGGNTGWLLGIWQAIILIKALR